MIENFKKNNPYSEIVEETKHTKIDKPWNDDSFIILLDKKDKSIQELKDVILVDYLAAIYHTKTDTLEFIFGPVEKEDENDYTSRKFDFNYEGETFKCYFDKVTKPLELLATGFQRSKSNSKTNHRELRMLNDFYTLDEQPEFIKEFFKNSEPYSFFIKGNLKKYKDDFTYFLRLLNFYLEYFDRECPQVIMYKKENYKEEFTVPCYSTDATNFPKSINATNIDFTILETLSIAHRTEDTRLQFIFYFQVLEYCTYYFLDTNIKKELNNILKRPDINSKSKEYSRNILENLQDHFNKYRNDSDKMEKIISEYISYDDIVLELLENADYFCSDIEFEGGLVIKKLFNKTEDIESSNDNMLTTIRRNIEKIRNVLVHLREQRENKVILPTPDNDKKLLPYLFIIKRIAEKIAIQYE
jgi:hypothetical protein